MDIAASILWRDDALSDEERKEKEKGAEECSRGELADEVLRRGKCWTLIDQRRCLQDAALGLITRVLAPQPPPETAAVFRKCSPGRRRSLCD